MIASSCKYESLASKDSFNASVRHIKATIGFAERVSGGENLADALNALIDEKSLAADEILPFVSMLLVEKFGYASVSKNLSATNSDLEGIHETVKAWNAFDIVIVYNHPDLGVLVINPKNKAHAARIDRVNKCELMVVYAGCFGKPFDTTSAAKAGNAVMALFEGGKSKDDSAFKKGSCSYKAPAEPKPVKEKAPKAGKAPAARKMTAKAGRKSAKGAEPAAPVQEAAAPAPKAAPPAPKAGSRMTPMYGVPVVNELFHNGNVEAWKRIITSYTTKHPDLQVLVYYDGERISDLNTLFKWGKVKHGSVIQFAVAGENICDVAKLQRYLAQGASPMFEAFLRGPVNSVLSLF